MKFICRYFEGTFADIQLEELNNIQLDGILLDPPWALEGQPSDGYSITPEELVVILCIALSHLPTR